jgi:Carboxymuconolactone decarboxylase family
MALAANNSLRSAPTGTLPRLPRLRRGARPSRRPLLQHRSEAACSRGQTKAPAEWLTEDVLFGDVWERAEFSPRDRSLVTIAALTAGGNSGQLPYHLNLGKQNGLTEAEIIEAIPPGVLRRLAQGHLGHHGRQADLQLTRRAEQNPASQGVVAPPPSPARSWPLSASW